MTEREPFGGLLQIQATATTAAGLAPGRPQDLRHRSPHHRCHHRHRHRRQDPHRPRHRRRHPAFLLSSTHQRTRPPPVHPPRFRKNQELDE